MEKDLKNIFSFEDKNVLVLGDSILDISYFGEAIGLSLETPTLKAEEKNTTYTFGGAFNVVENILELGAKCTFITLVGKDQYIKFYKKYNHENLDLIKIVENRKNTVKKRFWITRGNSHYKALQMNRTERKSLSAKSEREIIEFLDKNISEYDILLFVDYNGGLLTESLIDKIKKYDIKTIASSQISDNKPNHFKYKGSSLICLNSNEYEKNNKELNCNNTVHLSMELESNLCITSGEWGSELFIDDKKYYQPSANVKAIDPIGAGDAFLACLTLCDPWKFPNESLEISNIWAGLSTEKFGTEIISKYKLMEYLDDKRESSRNK